MTNASGKAVDSWDTSLLEVTYNGSFADHAGTWDEKNGVYVSDAKGINFDNLVVTLKAGAGNFKKYKVVTIFSTDALTGEQEPAWDEQYIYSYTYPITIEERTETLSEEVLESQSVKLTKTDYLEFFGKNSGEFASSWYARWYVTDADGAKQGIASSTGTGSNTWTVTHYQNNSGDWPTDRWKVNDNMVWSDNTGTNENEGWFIEETFFNNTRIAAPNGSTLADYAGYKIVFEITDENTPDHPIKLRYIFSIPSADPFLNKAKGDTKTTGSREIERTDETAAVEWGSSTTESPKYARVYLIDNNGTKLNSWNTDLLEVTYDGQPATHAGTKAKNGVYVYSADGVLDKSKLTVTLKAGAGNMRKYKVVTLFSTDAATFDGGGTTMTQEPQWDEEYTYSFTYPARGSFPAENINTVKTKYKTLLYNTSNRQCTPSLFSNWHEPVGDCESTRSHMAENGYARWYLQNKNTGELIQMNSLTSGDAYTSLGNAYGYYHYQFNRDNFRINGGSDDFEYTGYNPIITLPGDVDYKDVQVVCVVTTLTDDIDDLPDAEPEQLQVKYVYNLMTQDDLENLNDCQPFVHYKGETNRDYMTVEGTHQQEYSWVKETSTRTEVSDNIRQSVHQVDYYIYLDLQEGEKADLALPLEGWVKNDFYNDIPSNTEPLGFFRWYDWKSDGKADCLEKVGGLLRETNSGLILNRFINTRGRADTFRDEVGVDFVVPAGFSSMDEVVIACDVSRYMDGMDDSKTYLVHEPTLSTRYLFHVMPAKTIADDIDAKSLQLRTIEAALNNGTKESVTDDELNAMFKLTEDNGRVVVSLNGTKGEFTLRANLKELGHYFVNDGSNLVQGSQLQWYAYYQDADGALWKHSVDMAPKVQMYYASDGGVLNVWKTIPRSLLRLAKYQLSDFLGEYTKLGVGGETMQLESLPSGANLHVVGCIGNGMVEMPVSSYDLVFIDAAPKALGTETAQLEKTYASEMNVGAVLSFDDLFSDDESIRLAKPTTSAENYALMPQQWPMAQYGYCYPSLYGQDASSWAIYHSWWNGYGIGPTHGDYMLLKSMNMRGVSYTAGDSGDSNGTFDTQSYYAWWYTSGEPQLFDVTHERLYGKECATDGDDAKYGTYLYIDASEEARTYAHLEFDASLCAGAQIYYTAYIANMAEFANRPLDDALHKAPPQVMFRVTTDVDVFDTDGVTVIGQKRIPVVSFLTGDIESMGATDLGVWYMVSGHTLIPAELEELLDGTPRHYYVSIDNFAENTKGADYCVDEITFYTTSAKVKAHVTSERCDPGDGVTIRVDAEAEALLKALGDGTGQKNIFYRIYKKHDDLSQPIQEGEDLTGEGLYTDGSGQANDQFGTVAIDLDYDYQAALASVAAGTLVNSENGTPNSGFYRDADGVVHFQFVERRFDLTPGQGYFVSFYNFGYDRVSEPREWGNPYLGSACTVYSNYFFSNKVYIKSFDVETGQAASGVIDFACGVTNMNVDYNMSLQLPEEDGTVKEYTDVAFDYFVGRVNWNAEDNYPNAISLEAWEALRDAVKALRTITQDPITSVDNLPEAQTGFTSEQLDLIRAYMTMPVNEAKPEEGNKLLLIASPRFAYNFMTPGENYFEAIAVDETTSDGFDICLPVEMVFNVDDSSGGPKLTLGFDDVDYPASYKKQVLRVGLEQLRMMKEQGYKLHIPVKSFENKGHGISGKLYFPRVPGEYVKVTLSAINKTETIPATNDPILANKAESIGKLFAYIVTPTGNKNAYVNRTNMYLTLDLRDCEIDFHEGYEYEVSTSFYDAQDAASGATEDDDDNDIEVSHSENACFGDLYLVIKVVPEFVTWDATQIGETGYYNANWYNDDNWKRSVRADLYKDENVPGKKQNTSTPGHPNGYDDDGEGSLAALTGDLYNENPNPGYVPMKFTHVTLLGGNHAPSLINEVRVEAADGRSGADQGGSLIDPSNLTGTQMLTDPSPYTHLYSSYPTENIRYDMMVRYGDFAHGGVGCHGHRYLSASGWARHSAANSAAMVFDVEKFYGNTCKEIYFKPGAELLRQQRLYYQKAWVETELDANKWSIVSTPLQKTFAGDMYVPTEMNDLSLSMSKPAEKPGRQMTEAFQPINFSTATVEAQPTGENAHSSAPAYSRTKYPIYQRSWNTTGSRVYTKQNDARHDWYNANLPYSGVSSVNVEWSHTYNDVQVPYTDLTAFSIRPNRKVQKLGDVDVPALIRLPKADEKYDYYDWGDAGSTPAGGEQKVRNNETDKVDKTYYYADKVNHSEPLNHRFIIDGPDSDGELIVPISQLQQQDGYLLLGNPGMASIDMAKFFVENPDLDLSYWTYKNGEVVSYQVTKVESDDNVTYQVTPSTGGTGGIIKPLQAFFVKKGSASEVKFTRGMTIDGNFPGDVVTAAPSRPAGLLMRASSETGSSSATVRLSDSAADDYQEGEDVETLFDSNLAQVPMVYTVAGGQAVSIDQRPQLGVVPFGVTCADSNDPVSVQFSGLQSLDARLQASGDDGSVLSPLSTLYVFDALTGEQTEVGEGSSVQVQPNDYGRYFLTTTSRIEENLPTEHSIVVSVRHRDVTVVATEPLTVVSATTLGGVSVYSERVADTKCTFRLSPGVYIIDARGQDGLQRRLKVIVN